jgi:hypothetical protein
MQEELNNFERNQVWTLVERPETNVIGTKWVFRNKQDDNEVGKVGCSRFYSSRGLGL